MKVLFLGVGGVLNHDSWRPRKRMAYQLLRGADKYSLEIDPKCAAFLKRIVDETDAHIVISSSWRLVQERDEVLPAILQKFGIGQDRVIARTPRHNPALGMLGWPLPDKNTQSYPRGMEIHAWLQDWPEKIDTFAVLDDSAIVFTHLGYRPDKLRYLEDHFVQTSWGHGLQDKHVEKAVRLLGKA